MQLIVVSYFTYILLSIILTIWVAQTLYKRGRAFLVDVFLGNEHLADSVNHLLVVGFYLVNLGYIALALKQEGDVSSVRSLIEGLSTKLGFVSLVLGGMHFFNLAALTGSRKTQLALRRPEQPPYLRPPVNR